MRNPGLTDAYIQNNNSINLDEIPVCDIEEYDLADPKDYTCYLRDIKRFVRTSFEYRELIKWLRDALDMRACAVYEKVNNIDTYNISIEIHHHPFTLEDIIVTVVNKRTEERESLDIEDVCQEVMYLHYVMMVGLIPLSKTIHELVHGNFLFIPIDRVFGTVNEFILGYKKYMTPQILELYQENVKASETFKDHEQEYRKLLEVKHLDINIDNQPIPRLEDVLDLVRQMKNQS